jgi:hypothetical protein
VEASAGRLELPDAVGEGLVLEHVGVAALLPEVDGEGVARPHGREARVLLELDDAEAPSAVVAFSSHGRSPRTRRQSRLERMRTLAARARLATAGALGSAVLLAAAATQPQDPPAAASSLSARAEKEAFLLRAKLVGEPGPFSGARRSWKARLDDGRWTHDAGVITSTSRDRTRPDYRHHIAAYELDKALDLGLVSPSVERTLDGQPAALTWWVDDFLMNELTRRRQKIEPPDLESWDQQMQAVRVLDELMANAYRRIGLASYETTLWDNLLITREWRIWLTDHTRTFGTTRELENPDSLTRCDHSLLNKLRQLSRESLEQRLGRYLTSEQLDALEARRALIVERFDEKIAEKGEGAVLYELPARQ